MATRNPHPSELPEPSREARRRALHALSLMRSEGLSMTRAAAKADTTPDTMKKYAGRALEKQPSGRFEATPFDRIVREMRFLTADGVASLEVKDSRSASRIGAHMAAVDRFLRTGDETVLEPFRHKTVTSNGITHRFLTDAEKLIRLAQAGEVQFEHLYARV